MKRHIAGERSEQQVFYPLLFLVIAIAMARAREGDREGAMTRRNREEETASRAGAATRRRGPPLSRIE